MILRVRCCGDSGQHGFLRLVLQGGGRAVGSGDVVVDHIGGSLNRRCANDVGDRQQDAHRVVLIQVQLARDIGDEFGHRSVRRHIAGQVTGNARRSDPSGQITEAGRDSFDGWGDPAPLAGLLIDGLDLGNRSALSPWDRRRTALAVCAGEQARAIGAIWGTEQHAQSDPVWIDRPLPVADLTEHRVSDLTAL